MGQLWFAVVPNLIQQPQKPECIDIEVVENERTNGWASIRWRDKKKKDSLETELKMNKSTSHVVRFSSNQQNERKKRQYEFMRLRWVALNAFRNGRRIGLVWGLFHCQRLFGALLLKWGGNNRFSSFVNRRCVSLFCHHQRCFICHAGVRISSSLCPLSIR